jgi:hypothetical protein
VLDPSVHVDSAARGDDDDRVFIDRCNLLDELMLPGRQRERAVGTLAFGIETDGNDHRIGRCGELFHGGIDVVADAHNSQAEPAAEKTAATLMLEDNL